VLLFSVYYTNNILLSKYLHLRLDDTTPTQHQHNNFTFMVHLHLTLLIMYWTMNLFFFCLIFKKKKKIFFFFFFFYFFFFFFLFFYFYFIFHHLPSLYIHSIISLKSFSYKSVEFNLSIYKQFRSSSKYKSFFLFKIKK